MADDDTAIVGTCNLDFRSMYWNFEDFVYMYRTQCIGKIKEDAIETFAVSEEVYEESTNDISFAGRLLQSILQLLRRFCKCVCKASDKNLLNNVTSCNIIIQAIA